VRTTRTARAASAASAWCLTEEAARLYLLYMEREYGLLDSDYVFVNLWGGQLERPLNYAAVSRLVARSSRRVGFDFTPHDFRHTFVTPRPARRRAPGGDQPAGDPPLGHDHDRRLQPPGARGSAGRLEATGLLDPIAEVVG
jgi:integrase